MIAFTGERIVPEADNCEPKFALKMYQEHVARYLFASQACHGKTVLDVGCGVGYGSQTLARAGAASVVAFDIRPEVVEHARKFYSHPNLQFAVASAEEFNFNARFDMITCFELIEHVEQQHEVLARISQCLKPDGLLIVSTPRPLETKRSAFHVKELSAFDFVYLVESVFPHVQLYFENNHLASMVARELPASIERIRPLHPQFSFGQADYFVAVASFTPVPEAAFKPQIVLNDDAYVRNLERDVAVLHQAEDNLKQRLKDLSLESEQTRIQLAVALDKIAELKPQAEHLRDEAAAYHANLSRAEEKVREAEDAVRAANANTTEVELQLRLATEHNRDVLQNLTESQQHCIQLQAEAQKLHTAKDQHAASLARELEEAYREAAKRGAELEAARRQTEILRGEMAAVEQTAAALQSLQQATTDDCAALHSKIAEITALSESLQEEVAKRNADLAIAQHQIETLHMEVETAEQEKADLRRQLAEQTALAGKLYAELEQKLLEPPASPKEPPSHRAETEQLTHRRLTNLQARLNAANQQLTGLALRTREFEGREREFNRYAGQLLSLIRRSDDQKTALVARIRRMEEATSAAAASARLQIADLYNRLEDIYQSGSWRTTSPLRWAAGYLLQFREVLTGSRRLAGITEPILTAGVQRTEPAELLAVVSLPPHVSDVIDLAAPCEVPSSPNLGHTGTAGVPYALMPAPEPAYSGFDVNSPARLARHAFFDVIYINGCNLGESQRYRVFNMVEALNTAGYDAAWFTESDLPDLTSAAIQCHTLVLFRCPYSDALSRFMAYTRQCGGKVVWDVDDLIFEPESVHFVRVLSTFDENSLAHYMNGVYRYRKLLESVDEATATTAFLAARMAALGKPAHVIPNTLNDLQLSAAAELRQKRLSRTSVVRIGYFSGSNTHQVDFKQCEPALLSVMARWPECRFVLAGILDLGPEWTPYLDRVEQHAMMPYLRYLALKADLDINLAPLETGNPYCEAKSQLKIFEAGVVDVPTVASAVSGYTQAITDGVDGFLAQSTEDWERALTALVASPELRNRMGRAARERAIRQFGPDALREAAVRAYGFDHPAQTPDRKLKISWIVPGLIIGGGGHRNILRAAYYLEQFGYQLELYFTNIEVSEAQLRADVRENFYPLSCPMYRYDGSIAATDVLFATHWSTVDAALRAREAAGEIIYFVQDFEPLFAPMGTEYILAENTYRQGLYCITSGPWCAGILRRDFNAEADHFTFPVDISTYWPRQRTKQETNIIFFAKPEMPRRCFDLGMMALDHLHRKRPDIEIILFGSRHLEGRSFSFPATVRSVLPTIGDLAELYSNADIGMVFSTTNPSLVPYEMMACGLPVVDLKRSGNELNYDNRFDLALLADPSPELMAEDICTLLDDLAEQKRRSQNGLAFVKTFPSEIEMARRIESLILSRVAKKMTTPSGESDRSMKPFSLRAMAR